MKASQSSVTRRVALLEILGLFALVGLAYIPVWRAGFVWDDDAHVTRAALRSWSGLRQIWFHLGATQQYYPFVHSAFWIQYHLWGDNPLGYHLVNVVLHATAACLFLWLLRGLGVPGARLAALLFALHPISAESVAWVSEQKNTFSTVFGLTAALLFLRFRASGRWRWYAAATGAFALALMSKTTISVLPVCLLLVFWWQSGGWSWRRDVAPLAPWIALGGFAGLFTAWVERHFIGAQGADFRLSLLQRCELAGRVTWFYLGKLAWPAHLVFIYPHWKWDGALAWRIGAPGVLAALVAAWAIRRRTRAPLTLFLGFLCALFPALGFFNVYPFLFSYVADHFLYLASLWFYAAVGAGATLLALRSGRAARIALIGAAVAVLGLLARATFLQTEIFRDVPTFYASILAGNPECWLAYNNWGLYRQAHGDRAGAISDYRNSLKYRPGYAEAENNLGTVLADEGHWSEAEVWYRRALVSEPNFPHAAYNLGKALTVQGHNAAALRLLQAVLPEFGDLPDLHYTIANIEMADGDRPAAEAEYRVALKIHPDFPEALNNLGAALALDGHTDQAIALYERALKLKPDYPDADYNLGVALDGEGRYHEAIQHYLAVVRLDPGRPNVYVKLGSLLRRSNHPVEAARLYVKALQRDPSSGQAHYELGLVLRAIGKAREADVQFALAKQLGYKPE